MRVLRGVSLEVARGEFSASMGPSGWGKSTLLNLIAGLDEPDEGTISIDGDRVTGQPESHSSLVASHLGNELVSKSAGLHPPDRAETPPDADRASYARSDERPRTQPDRR